MLLACNSLPGVLCGYVENPSDAYLFGRINNGNAISFPLGLNFGWAGEINLQCTLDKLFDGPFGIGYPKQDAIRKQKDTKLLKAINGITKRELSRFFRSVLNTCTFSTADNRFRTLDLNQKSCGLTDSNCCSIL